VWRDAMRGLRKDNTFPWLVFMAEYGLDDVAIYKLINGVYGLLQLMYTYIL
jgi:hypothetical protein